MLDANSLGQAVRDPKLSQEFRDVVVWITEEIAFLGELDERVTKGDDVNTFLIELTGFLSEMQCPITAFVAGPVSSRLQDVELRFGLLEFLLGELMAHKMVGAQKADFNEKKVDGMKVKLQESTEAAALMEICKTLNLGKPPANITWDALFEKINQRLEERMKQYGKERVGNPLFNPEKPLTDAEWYEIEKIADELEEEYNLRRKMLLTRLECTIQSFLWSDRAKGKEDQILEAYAKKKQELDEFTTGGDETGIPGLMSARDNLPIFDKTSNANVRRNTQSKIQRHIIGRVPDRGGRAYEHQVPPPEMPSWQKNRAGGPPGGGGGGGRGGGRGGGQRGGGNRGGNNQGGNYHQKGNQGGGYQNQGNYQNQGGYQGQGGGYQNQGQRGNQYQNQGYQGGNNSYQGNQGGSGGYDNNRQNYNNQGQSRVQGGWSQRGGNDDRRGSGGGGGYDDRRGDYQQRGQSNYNRGGRR